MVQMNMQRHVGHTNIRLEVCQEAYTLQVRSSISLSIHNHTSCDSSPQHPKHVSAYQSRHDNCTCSPLLR